MPTEVIMPKIDMDMTSGKMTVWHVTEGTKVVQGTPIFDIETDKAAMEIESTRKIVVSGGHEKVAVLRGALKLLKPLTLVTDEQTAAALLE